MSFQWGFNYICFFQYLFYCQDSNAIQTDTECIKISYPLVLPVCTDRICTSTIKLTQMNLILFWKQVNNAGVVPLLLIIPCIFFSFFFLFWNERQNFSVRYLKTHNILQRSSMENFVTRSVKLKGNLQPHNIKSKMVLHLWSRI